MFLLSKICKRWLNCESNLICLAIIVYKVYWFFTPFRPIESAILPLVIDPIIAPIVIIEPKTEYYKTIYNTLVKKI